MSKKRYLRNQLSVLVILILLVVLPGCGYFWRALVYQKVGILDYHIFHNRRIDVENPQPWQKHPLYNSYSMPQSYTEYMDSLKTVGFVVIQDGKLLYERYATNWSDTAISNSFSMAKSIISMMIGICIDKGYIKSEDDFVRDYIPEFNTPENRNLTIKHLLNMTSGLNWNEAYANPWSTTTKAYYGTQLEKQVLKLKVVEPSDVKYDYKSGDTQLLAIIIRNATGMPVAEFMEKYLWKKIGAETPALWCLDHKNGLEKAYCCVNATAKDFARLGQLILNQGMWNDEVVLSKNYIEKMLTPASHLIDEFGKTNDYYGYQWWKIMYNNHTVHYMRGINGQYVFIIPDKNAVIVRLGHKRSKVRINDIPSDLFEWLNIGLDILSKAEQ
ncbi:MAG TPA: serine hydrolase domain-containing protein, partial [Salinivirgaceae bacterium]|nr:serine hydrolase domain-containing protein [Salinivirgaceae bacterium]